MGEVLLHPVQEDMLRPGSRTSPLCAEDDLDRLSLADRGHDVQYACGNAACSFVGFNDTDNLTVAEHAVCFRYTTGSTDFETTGAAGQAFSL